MKSIFVFCLLVAAAIAAPLETEGEDKLALPSDEEVSAVVAASADIEDGAVVELQVETQKDKASVNVNVPVLKPKARVPVLASRFREQALAVVSAPAPRRRVKPAVVGAVSAPAVGKKKKTLKAKVTLPVVAGEVSVQVEEPKAAVAVSADVEQPKAAVAVSADVEQPKAAVAVSADVEQPKAAGAVSADVEQPKAAVAVSADVEEPKVAVSVPVVKPEVAVAVSVPVVKPKVEAEVSAPAASLSEKPRLKSKKGKGSRRKFRPYVAPKPVERVEEEGEKEDPRANDPVTLVRAHSDYNIFERTYDYGFESVDGIKIKTEGGAQIKKEDEEDGVIARGSYSYPGVDGRLVVVNWVADANGYRASSSNILPDKEEQDLDQEQEVVEDKEE